MVNIAPAPFSMNRGLLKAPLNNYEASVSSAKIVATTTVSKFKGIDGSTVASASEPDNMLVLTFAQDWTTEDSLSQHLLDGHGTIEAWELTPEAGGVKAQVNVLLVQGDFGGDVDATAVATVNLQIIGQPVYV